MINSINKAIKKIGTKSFDGKLYNIRSYWIQFLVFGYCLFRYSSRSYEAYGLIDPTRVLYQRWWVADLWQLPALHFSSFQFIYDFIPYPGTSQIRVIQYGICIFSILGLIGIIPRISSIILFLSTVHLEGILISADAEISGGTVLIAVLLLFPFTPNAAFYRLLPFNIKAQSRTRSANFLVINYCLILGLFYFLPGINKIVDCGLNWPLTVRLDLLAVDKIQTQYFFNVRYVSSWITETQVSFVVSVLGGTVTLMAELAAIMFITNFRYNYLIVSLLIAMHSFVYLIAGINFTGNSLLLLGVINISTPFEKANIYFDDKCNFCTKSIKILQHLKPKNIEYVKLSSIKDTQNLSFSKERCQKAICLTTDSDTMYGYNSIANLFLRSNFSLVGIAMHIIPLNLLGILLYYVIAKNRYLIAGKCKNDSCIL